MVTPLDGAEPDDNAGVESTLRGLASIPSWILGGMKATYSQASSRLPGGRTFGSATETISLAEGQTIFGPIQP
jgi:hypothetical protein